MGPSTDVFFGTFVYRSVCAVLVHTVGSDGHFPTNPETSAFNLWASLIMEVASFSFRLYGAL